MRLPGFTFQWHFTDTCNLRCRHCYREGAEVPGLPPERMEALLADILESAARLRAQPCLGLTGGEPLARPDLFFGLLDHLRRRYEGQTPVTVTLMTNGTLITPELARRLDGYYPLLRSAQVSLDGAGPATNDAIRGRGSFAAALEGIRQLVAHTRLQVVISYTFHAGNLPDLEGMVRLAEEAGAHVLYATRLVPIGRGQELGADGLGGLSAERVRQALEYLYRKDREFAPARARGERKPSMSLERTLFHLVDPDEAVRRLEAHRRAAAGDGGNGGGGGVPGLLGNACAVGFSTATILADGTLLACRRLPLPVGNLERDRFLELWGRSDLLWKFRARARRLKGKCRACRFNHDPLGALCGGGAACISYACRGDFDLPDPHCWYQP